MPKTQEEIWQNERERAKTNDPVALREMGNSCHEKGDFEGAVEYFTKAAALGNIGAHYNLSLMYRDGAGVEKDTKKEMHHLEEAAIGGHADARYNLGCFEHKAGRMDREMKHFIIGSKLGDNDALKMVKDGFRRGFVSKEDFEAALRGHQAAVDATKSEQREEAYIFDIVDGIRRGRDTVRP